MAGADVSWRIRQAAYELVTEGAESAIQDYLGEDGDWSQSEFEQIIEVAKEMLDECRALLEARYA